MNFVITYNLQMLRRDYPLTDKTADPPKLQNYPENHPHKIKISNLTPYLSEIERRKKQRLQQQRSKKLIHDSSSKSFRIKEKSVASLQKQLLKRANPTTKPIIRQNDGCFRQKRTQSVNRHHEYELSRTIESKNEGREHGSTTFFNQLHAKVKSRMEKTAKQKRQQVQTLEDQRSRSQQVGDLNMYKISLTNIENNRPAIFSKSEKIPERAPEQQPKKKNPRRNKYEIASSQDVLEKKEENNTEINIEMDRLAAYQNQAFVKARNRELHGSIERSTEKYLNYQSYRRPSRSKNEIEIYLSSIANPSLAKVSKSTNEQSNSRNRFQLVNSLKGPSRNCVLQYDFDFKNEQQKKGVIEKQEKLVVQQNFVVLKQQDEFQKQRRKVEIEFFNKGEPQLDWSEDECKVDEI